MRYTHPRTRSQAEVKALNDERRAAAAQRRDDAEKHKKEVMERTKHYAPRSSKTFSAEVMKNIRKKKRTAVDFSPCIDDRQVPRSLLPEATLFPCVLDVMEAEEKREFVKGWFKSQLRERLEDKIADMLAEKIVFSRQCREIEAMPSETQEQE